MRTQILAAFAMLSSMTVASPAPADEPSPGATTAAVDSRGSGEAPVEADTRPVMSADSTWAGSVVIAIGAMFLAAMVVGPVVRAEMATEAPVVAAGNDEHSAHHGEHH